MTSSNENIFRVTGRLCGEFTGHWWIPRTKAGDTELWFFSLICTGTNIWANNGDAGDLRRHCAHYDVIVKNLGQYQLHQLSISSSQDVCEMFPCSHQADRWGLHDIAGCVIWVWLPFIGRITIYQTLYVPNGFNQIYSSFCLWFFNIHHTYIIYMW